jgi:hypothetical protein
MGSFPKEQGIAAVLALLDKHHHDAKNAMIDRELRDFC